MDVEVARFLTEKAGFPRVPKTLGTLEFRRAKREAMTVGLLREWVPNQGQAWELMVEVLGRYFEEVQGEAHRLDKIDPDLAPVLALSDREVPGDVHEVIGSGLLMARTLGRRTAEMHLALASDPADPAFAPEPLTPEELARLSDDLKGKLLAGLAALKEQFDTLPDDVRKLAEEVLAARPGSWRWSPSGPRRGRGWSRSGSTATTTSASSSGARMTSTSSISRGSRAGRPRSVAPSSPR